MFPSTGVHSPSGFRMAWQDVRVLRLVAVVSASRFTSGFLVSKRPCRHAEQERRRGTDPCRSLRELERSRCGMGFHREDACQERIHDFDASVPCTWLARSSLHRWGKLRKGKPVTDRRNLVRSEGFPARPLRSPRTEGSSWVPPSMAAISGTPFDGRRRPACSTLPREALRTKDGEPPAFRPTAP
jgi:hypothetical protein